MGRHVVTAGIATLAMGIAVTISWIVIGIGGEGFGMDWDAITRPGRLAIYAIQMAFVAAIGHGLTRWRLSDASATTLALVMAAAWLGQGMVLTVIGEPIVANEIDPTNAWWFWLVATAGPLQPLVAFLGGWPALTRPSAQPQL